MILNLQKKIIKFVNVESSFAAVEIFGAFVKMFCALI